MSRLVVFDCDGTLVDGQAAICETMEQAFASAGLVAPDRHHVRRMVGLSLPYVLRELAPTASDEERHAVVEAYKSGFRDLRLSGELREPLFEGIGALIDELDGAGHLLAVATGKSDRGLIACLDTHGIRERFVSLQTADRHPSYQLRHGNGGGRGRARDRRVLGLSRAARTARCGGQRGGRNRAPIGRFDPWTSMNRPKMTLPRHAS